MKRLLALSALLFAASGWAQVHPVGVWRSTDSSTGQPKAQIRIVEVGGVLSGRVEKMLRPGVDPAARCAECSGDRKDRPIVGMEIIRGARQVPGRQVWEGGEILDPEDGREYTLRLTPIDGGQRMEVRGSFGPFGRTQVWQRVP